MLYKHNSHIYRPQPKTIVYAEVADFDVVGIGNMYGIIVEMKKNLSWKLIEQAHSAIGKRIMFSSLSLNRDHTATE